jgi:UDP-3-O-[3-hydroxymyristoyl] glucosamine N-acyltransferase
VVRVADPQLAFARLAQHLHPGRRFAPGVSEKAAISAGAEVDPTATVMAFAVVERGAKVGARAVLHPGVYLGEGASVGDDSVLYPNVTVGERCEVGRRCVLHASAVVGADGFGFAFDHEKPEHVKIPQRGIARLEDDVELGACSTVDRATFGQTLIGRGTKIDNLVQIAHNVTVGPMSILCAQVGVSGSTRLGQGVLLGGQVGISGHLEVGALARVVAQSGVAQDVEPGATLFGSPAIDHRQFLKASAAFPKLPELIKELRALRKRVDALERKGEHT